MTKYYSGKFKPKYPDKYRGDPTNITYRSSWELNCMTYFDKNPDIVWWASEELVIPYISPIDGRRHRYFPDFIIKTKLGEVVLIEVKPFKETHEPKPQKRMTKKYLREVQTWGVNQAKWKAAIEFCEDRRWTFKVLTEKELFGKKHK